METIKRPLSHVFALAAVVVTVWSFLVPDAKGFVNPAFARIFFWHFPCPIHACILQFLGAYFSYKAITTRDRRWDIRAESAMELSMMFIILTLITGILFSKLQWGAWWQRDPRQESYLLVFLVYCAYFVIRTAFQDRDKRAINAAGYALFALIPAQFLTFVFPRLPQIQKESFHPTTSIMSGQIKGQYAYVIIGTMCLVAVVAYRLYQIRTKAGLLEFEAEQQDGRMEVSRGNPPSGPVVRPISVSPKG